MPRCKNCKEKFIAKLFLQKTCLNEVCVKEYKESLGLKEVKKVIKKPINKVSKKRTIENLKYKVLRIEFLGKEENKICFIDGCNKQSNSIEHLAGRWGTNFLDVNTWAGCCIEHNLELENNPELSKKCQFSKITGKRKNND